MSATVLDFISAGYIIDERFPLFRELGRTEWTSAWLTEIDGNRMQKAAIKIFPSEAVDSRTTRDPWDLAATLSHPHLMPLFHAGRCALDGGNLLYVVTEYADEVLSHILTERPLSPEEALEMLGPVLSALSYLHEHGLAHGHLRPTNIMVIDDRLKLSPDFGWRSRKLGIYDPPEAGAGHVTPAADIWSLGILLIEALTQLPPVWFRSQGGEPEIPATIPEPFFTICRECLRTDPKRRCTLAGIKAHLNPPHAEPADECPNPIVDRTGKSSYRFRATIFAGAVVAVLCLIGAFKLGWNLPPSSPALPAQPPVAAQPPATAPAPDAATASTSSAASNVRPAPAPTPAPAIASAKSGAVKGTVALQVLPRIPGTILGAIHGHVRVGIRVEVDTEGKVYEASIDSPGPSRYFADKALQAARDWKFAPAQFAGSATDSTWYLLFQFGESQSVVTSSEEFP